MLTEWPVSIVLWSHRNNPVIFVHCFYCQLLSNVFLKHRVLTHRLFSVMPFGIPLIIIIQVLACGIPVLPLSQTAKNKVKLSGSRPFTDNIPNVLLAFPRKTF